MGQGDGQFGGAFMGGVHRMNLIMACATDQLH